MAAAMQAAVQTRHEVLQTEQTTVVFPEELGWLGMLSARRNHHSASTSTTLAGCGVAAWAAGPTALLRCAGCQRTVIAGRMPVHQQSQCPQHSLGVRVPLVPTSGAARACAVPPGGKRGSGANSGGGGSGSGGSGHPKEPKPHHSKKGAMQRVAVADPPEGPPTEASAGGAWEPSIPPAPLPRAQTNLSKVTYPYLPQLGSLLDDFMESVIDRFVFPRHLKKHRVQGRRR